ncbi:MAG: N,N-dimethylformamidase beta subunit family domain-containing protein [Tepidisphaeraceae bacterium]
MKRSRRHIATVSRRELMQRTGAGVASMMAASLSSRAEEPAARSAHLALDVPGVHIYCTEHSIAAAQTAGFHVSASVPYRLSICRLGWDADSPSQDEVLHEFAPAPANPQTIHPGSYIHVEKHLGGPLRAITLECWVRSWDATKLQPIISQGSVGGDKDSSEGFALTIGKGGAIGFFLGDGISPDQAMAHRTKPGAVAREQWHHLVATWDGRRKRVFVDAKEAGAWDFAGPLLPGKDALRLGAMAQAGVVQHFLDGDLAIPAIYERALSAQEIADRFAQRGIDPARGEGLLACWPLTEERGDTAADGSGQHRHGRIINHATWMIGGPSFKADVPRFGQYDPVADAAHGHGLRFASDDLYDCRWSVTHRWTVPENAKPGIYVARAAFEFEGKARTYHCTFVVRRAPRHKKAPIVVLAATNTWRAYSGTPFAITPAELAQFWSTDGLPGSDPKLPSSNLYSPHRNGQGTYQVGLRMPWPAAGPYVLYGGPTRYSHLLRAERFTHIWLEREGYDYDLVSDVDLHRDPGLLSGYSAVVIAGHSEYWSIPMFRGLETYLKGGGNLVCLSANTLFWRVSFDDDCTVMEGRKADAAGGQVHGERRGEAWHSHDGLRGGMMRECGWPGWKLIGLETFGFNDPNNPANFGHYTVENPDHFLFNRPEMLGLKKGDAFGQGPDGALPCANGHEFDIRLSTLASLQEQPSPPGGSVPTDPPEIQLIANGTLPWKEGGQAFDYFFRPITPKTNQGGEMIYWERPEGGRVFNGGAIGFGWTLNADAKLAGVLRNVLAHFGVKKNHA